MSGRTYEFSLTGPADDDVVEIIDWSENEFGTDAADRYEKILQQALIDIAENPLRLGTKYREDLNENIYIYHLNNSLNRVQKPNVKAPRHFVVYRIIELHIEVLRILHDSRDLALHLP